MVLRSETNDKEKVPWELERPLDVHKVKKKSCSTAVSEDLCQGKYQSLRNEVS